MLDYVVDALLGVQKLRIQAQNRITILLSQERRDTHTETVHKRLTELEAFLRVLVKEEMSHHPAWPWLEQIPGVGLENSAKVVGLIEGTTFKSTGRSSIQAFDTMSKFRRYIGLAVLDGQVERKHEGETLHYNNELRSMLWRIGKSIIMLQAPLYAEGKGGKFYEFYLRKKQEYEERYKAEGKSILPTPKGRWGCRGCGAQFGKKVEVVGCCPNPFPEKLVKEEPHGVIFLGHLEHQARRKLVTMFSDMLYIAWREAIGLPDNRSYIAGKEPIRQHRPEDFIG